MCMCVYMCVFSPSLPLTHTAMAPAGKEKLVIANQVADNKDQCQSETGENDVPAPSIPVNEMAAANRNREYSYYGPCRAYWSPVDEEFFISLVIKQVQAGKMNSGRFNSKTWNYIKNRLNKAQGKNFSLNALKGKYYRLKRNWQEFKTLLDFSSKFVWEPKANAVMAPEEVWTHYLQVYPKNKRFKKKGCKYYTLLTKIFRDQTGGAHFARSSADTQSLSNQEKYSSHSVETTSEMGIENLMERVEALELWTKYLNAKTQQSYAALKRMVLSCQMMSLMTRNIKL